MLKKQFLFSHYAFKILFLLMKDWPLVDYKTSLSPKTERVFYDEV